ncbi:MAG TPA: GNAT family N-acetyltransferase [Aestuariivirgaceae bacterium]
MRQLRSGDDTAEAENLLVSFFREEGFATPVDLIRFHCRQMLGLDICGLFLAETADEGPAGVATVSLNFGIEYGWLGEMGDLYVVPACRGRGIARALVQAVESFLRLRGATGYQVTVTPHARRTYELEKLYIRLGFAAEGREILFRELAS